VDLSELALSIQARLDAKNAAREQALPAARRSIRASANAIRAIHRLELDTAETLIRESRAALDEGLAAVKEHADIRHAGYLQDAQKEFVEANLTLALVTGTDLSGPTELDVEDAAYLSGMSDAIGEGRRRILDLLREGEVEHAERLLAMMEEMFGVLVTMDYPDAITMNLRRVTDVSRSLIEKTRGDVSISAVQKDLRDALDRHTEELRKG
jgi:translin